MFRKKAFNQYCQKLADAALLGVSKRLLLAARTATQDANAAATRAGDTDLAERLREIAERLADELDYVDRQIASMP